jgi:hypothetical protein
VLKKMKAESDSEAGAKKQDSHKFKDAEIAATRAISRFDRDLVHEQDKREIGKNPLRANDLKLYEQLTWGVVK